eukprot:Rmarinus@m.7700
MITEESSEDQALVSRSRSHSTNSSRYPVSRDAQNFQVVIRVRPPLPHELHNTARTFVNCVRTDDRTVNLFESVPDENGEPTVYATHGFTFDRVYGERSTQREVYENTARAAVHSSLQGYNATIIAYGQTGTGKTYTMEGKSTTEEVGIIPRAMEEIFYSIDQASKPDKKFLVRASYLQIYNEVISDLLQPEQTNLAIREDKKRGVFVEDLSEWIVKSPTQIYHLLDRGSTHRVTGSTKINEISSRSHAVFIIIVEQSESIDGGTNQPTGQGAARRLFKVGKLNLVDLAGSERVHVTGATGKRLEESKKINQSLSALGNVIAALTEPKGRQHIPYRDSKLTRLLEDSLGGNCKTTMMAMVSPALEAFHESLSTVKFAHRAKKIKNEARINEDADQTTLLRKYERELKRLRAELAERAKHVVDKRHLLLLEEERKKAEQDKLAAITALENRSLEVLKEKEEKKRLELRITELQGQLLVPGAGDSDQSVAFHERIRNEQMRIRKEYEEKVQELERERQTIEEDKAQVSRYKQLLVKQRDIMIALTARLDETVAALQEERSAHERQQAELEDIIDEKSAELIRLKKKIMEGQTSTPDQCARLVKALNEWAIGGSSALAVSGLSADGGPSTAAPSAQKLDPVITDEFDARVRDYQSQIEELKARNADAEERLRATDRFLQLGDLGGLSADHRKTIARLFADHTEMLEVATKRGVGRLREALDRKDSERQRLQAELDRYKKDAGKLGSPVVGGRTTQGRLDSSAQEELDELRRRVHEAEGALLSRDPAAIEAAVRKQVDTMKHQTKIYLKERDALKTIMEKKIKVLVENTSQILSDSQPQDLSAWLSFRDDLKREVQCLHRLVHASVSALNNNASALHSATPATPTAAHSSGAIPSRGFLGSSSGRSADFSLPVQVPAAFSSTSSPGATGYSASSSVGSSGVRSASFGESRSDSFTSGNTSGASGRAWAHSMVSSAPSAGVAGAGTNPGGGHSSAASGSDAMGFSTKREGSASLGRSSHGGPVHTWTETGRSDALRNGRPVGSLMDSARLPSATAADVSSYRPPAHHRTTHSQQRSSEVSQSLSSVRGTDAGATAGERGLSASMDSSLQRHMAGDGTGAGTGTWAGSFHRKDLPYTTATSNGHTDLSRGGYGVSPGVGSLGGQPRMGGR